jgi:hypothetical protein
VCDRRVLEAMGHDSLVDLIQQQCRVIQELDATVAGLRAERQAELAGPQRYVTGVPEGITLPVTPEAWQEAMAHPLDHAVFTGAQAGQESAPPDDQTRDTEPVGHEEPGEPTPGEGAARSDVPQSPDSWHWLAHRGPQITWPDRVRDATGDTWKLVDSSNPNRPHYLPEVDGMRPWWRLEAIAREWGPLTAVEE